MSIGKRIKEKRLAKNYTLEKLAEYLGVTKSTVLRYENETIAIPSDKIERVAEALKCSPAYLMGWNSNNEDIITITNEKFKIIEKNNILSIQKLVNDKWLIFELNENDKKEFKKVVNTTFAILDDRASEESKKELYKTFLKIFIESYLQQK